MLSGVILSVLFIFIHWCNTDSNDNQRNVEIIFQCDHIFDSSIPEGEFQLPMLPPSATVSEQISQTEGAKNLQCIYTFVASPKQRVKLNFDQFHLAGTAGNCETEYVDIYSELEEPDDDLLLLLSVVAIVVVYHHM